MHPCLRACADAAPVAEIESGTCRARSSAFSYAPAHEYLQMVALRSGAPLYCRLRPLIDTFVLK